MTATAVGGMHSTGMHSYIFTDICDSVHRGSASVHAGMPPGKEIPLARSPPGKETPLARRPPPCALHAGRYGLQAGGMHPTGMQSCFTNLPILLTFIKNILFMYCTTPFKIEINRKVHQVQNNTTIK